MKLIEYSADLPSPTITDRNQWIIILTSILLAALFVFYFVQKDRKNRRTQENSSDPIEEESKISPSLL
jgi:hypothetical protein